MTYCPDNYEKDDDKCKFMTDTTCKDLGLYSCNSECTTTKSKCK